MCEQDADHRRGPDNQRWRIVVFSHAGGKPPKDLRHHRGDSNRVEETHVERKMMVAAYEDVHRMHDPRIDKPPGRSDSRMTETVFDTSASAPSPTSSSRLSPITAGETQHVKNRAQKTSKPKRRLPERKTTTTATAIMVPAQWLRHSPPGGHQCDDEGLLGATPFECHRCFPAERAMGPQAMRPEPSHQRISRPPDSRDHFAER